MKNQLFLIGLTTILFSVLFTACDDFVDALGQGLAEVVCPTVTTEYEHQQVVRNAVFTPCYTSDYGIDIELEMTINGVKSVFTNDTTLNGISRDVDIPLKIAVEGYEVCGIQVESTGAPLAGGENGHNDCESSYINKQSNTSGTYCLAELSETLGIPLTENRETRLIVSAFKGNCSESYNDKISITINYIE